MTKLYTTSRAVKSELDSMKEKENEKSFYQKDKVKFWELLKDAINQILNKGPK